MRHVNNINRIFYISLLFDVDGNNPTRTALDDDKVIMIVLSY